MGIIVVVLIAVVIYCAIAAPVKRSKHTAKCPKCGTTCKASPWGTSLYHEAQYTCPHCGHHFYEHYSKL